VEKARDNLRSIMDIPQDRQIWFLGGGCHLQFAGLPLNFLGEGTQATANYTTSGYFSKLAFNEAKRYCRAKSIMEYKVDEKGQFYLPEEFDFDPKAVYTHFIDN
jgi:phosphoserine aminotransferase